MKRAHTVCPPPCLEPAALPYASLGQKLSIFVSGVEKGLTGMGTVGSPAWKMSCHVDVG
jgi:hypothetical protein